MHIFDKLFRDNNGELVYFQSPNLPLIVYLLSIIAGLILEGYIKTIIVTLGDGALFVFGWLELFYGVNVFRKLLGFIVLFILLASSAGQ